MNPSNRKQHLWIIAGFLIVCIAIFTFLQKSMRESYEEFLLLKYADFKQTYEKDYDEILKPDNPEMAFYQNYLMTIDPKIKRVPLERLQKARIQAEEIARKKRSSNSMIDIQWSEVNASAGGRTRAIMFDPNDPDRKKVWAGAVTGGLWSCNDITSNLSVWTPYNDQMDNLSISCLTYDPNNTNIFYAGTGEAQTAITIYRESSGRGSGILRSTNGGNTWEIMPSTSAFAYVTDIVVRNEKGKSVIYAGVVSGRYKGADYLANPSDGLYRSDDEGETWKQVLPEIPGKGTPYAPADIELATNGRLFVGSGRNINGDGGAMIFYSDDGTNWDINATWANRITGDTQNPYPGRIILAAAPSDPQIVYAFVASGRKNGSFINPDCYFILRSADGGKTWVERTIPQYKDSQNNWAYIAWHALIGKVHPENPDVVFAGGLDLWKSTNGGKSWTQISSWFNFNNDASLPNYVHADQHNIKFRPNNPDEMIFSTDGGVFYTNKSNDYKPQIHERNAYFNTLQYYACAIHPEAGFNYFLAGAQDNGTFMYDGSGTAVTIFDNISYGDGGFCFIDSNEPHLQITSSQYNYYYATPDDQNYTLRDSVIQHYQHRYGIFINPCDYDSRRNRLYANATSFEGANADQIAILRNMNKSIAANNFVNINKGNKVAFSHIKISPYEINGKSVLFAGTMAGRLFRITDIDNNPDVEEIGDSKFPAGNISCVAIGEKNDHVLVTFSNYGVVSVWETKDGGNNWRNIEGNLPDIPVRWAVFHPIDRLQVLLATELGVWGTDFINAEEVEWQPVSSGMPNVRVDMIRTRVADNTILLATHGRGLFISNSVSVSITGNEKQKPEFKLFPNPALDITYIECSNISSRTLQLSLLDQTGRLIKTSNYSNTEKIELNISELKTGIYFIRIFDGNNYLTKKLIKQ